MRCDLTWLLGPNAERWRSDAAPRHPVWQRATAPDRFTHLFDLDDVERYLIAVRPGEESLRLVGGPEDSRLDYTKPQHILHAWRAGGTIVLNGAHQRWPALLTLAADLGADLAARVGVNVYCSLPGGGGFPEHVDDHDLFVLQTWGRKRWAVGSGSARRELDLESGDVLYLPRGTPHHASTLDSGSLHLTVGVYPLRWVDLAHAVVDALASHHPELQSAVPLCDVPAHGRETAALLSWLTSMDSRDPAPLEPERLAEALRAERSATAPLPVGGLRSVALSAELNLATRLRRRPGGTLVHGREAGGRVWMRLGDCHMRLPASAQEAVAFLEHNAGFAVGDLPDAYADATKCLLASRWVREGFATLDP